MASTVSGRLHPSTIDKMTAGAAMITPALRPRDSRKRELAKARVFTSNRFLQIFVRREDPCPIEEGHERERQDDHGDRQAEIELHEPHAIGIPLGRSCRQG